MVRVFLECSGAATWLRDVERSCLEDDLNCIGSCAQTIAGSRAMNTLLPHRHRTLGAQPDWVFQFKLSVWTMSFVFDTAL